jgi:hypothetical protein
VLDIEEFRELMDEIGRRSGKPLTPIQADSLSKLCYAVLCYAVLCYAMLCYAMLCYAMLCYAMLCYAMLCYAMPGGLSLQAGRRRRLRRD